MGGSSTTPESSEGSISLNLSIIFWLNTANSIFSTDTKLCLAYLQFVFFSPPSQAPDFQFRHQEEIPKTDEEIRVTAAGSVSVRQRVLGLFAGGMRGFGDQGRYDKRIHLLKSKWTAQLLEKLYC